MTGLPFGDPSMAGLNGKATPEIGRESEILKDHEMLQF
jgi:hypothetical protein